MSCSDELEGGHEPKVALESRATEAERPGLKPGRSGVRYQRTVNDCFRLASELEPAYTSIWPGSTTNLPRLS